jgi:2-iminobutanoate/2-iminopropanoate deaminase
MGRIEAISTEQAPEAIGPYSQGVLSGGILHCSGSLPIDPASGELEQGPPAAQLSRCLSNLDAVCRAAGTSLDRALMVTIFTTRLEEFGAINEAYAGFFAGPDYPARAAVGVAALPKGAEVEVTAQVATPS